jgi:HPt (histidine-containing phosphotransfer) domain-containing protein
VSARGKKTPGNQKSSVAVKAGVPLETEAPLDKKTLQGLKELGLEMGPSFFPQLLDTFEHDAVEHLSVVRAAITESDTRRLGQESHALKGACLTIGARRMADLSKQLESLGIANSMVGAPLVLAQMEHEFDRVKNEIEQERLTL